MIPGTVAVGYMLLMLVIGCMIGLAVAHNQAGTTQDNIRMAHCQKQYGAGSAAMEDILGNPVCVLVNRVQE